MIMRRTLFKIFAGLVTVVSLQLVRVIMIQHHHLTEHSSNQAAGVGFLGYIQGLVFGFSDPTDILQQKIWMMKTSLEIEHVFGHLPSWNNSKLAKREVRRSVYVDLIKNFCKPSRRDVCPCDWSNLRGFMWPSEEAEPENETLQNNPDVTAGGVWVPRNCTPRHLVAIIIPFKNRTEHLKIFLAHIHPFLQRQGLGYRIIVVEQMFPKLFNKAAIMNIGFKEAEKLGHFDCFIFHDVDMLPEDDRHLYICTDKPGHLGYSVKKFNYTLPYSGLFGGATAFTSSQFHKINGFSNLFWGWGGEDDDMYKRVHAARYKIIRFPRGIARYTNIPHTRDNPVNHKNTIGFNYRPKHYRHDGLNSLKYTLRRITLEPLVTRIQVSIPR